MSVDDFNTLADSPAEPARRASAITPHDTDELAVLPKALYIGTGGALVVRAVDSAGDVTFKNLASGQILDVRAQYVRATGTTAADIVALA
ncbi:MAG: hypothetical protein WC803_02555 [Sphingomonas sp.]|jgi:hypothetical protein